MPLDPGVLKLPKPPTCQFNPMVPMKKDAVI
jgi:hypothetical protein